MWDLQRWHEYQEIHRKKKALNRGQETGEDMRELEFGQRPEQWWGAGVEAAKSTKRLELLASQSCWSVPNDEPTLHEAPDYRLLNPPIGLPSFLCILITEIISKFLRASFQGREGCRLRVKNNENTWSQPLRSYDLMRQMGMFIGDYNLRLTMLGWSGLYIKGLS